MHVSVFLVVCSLSSVLSQAFTSVSTSFSSVTPPPSIPTSGLPQAFIGYSYVSQLGAFTTYFCQPGYIWSTVGRYARCCTADPNEECGMPTACLNTSLLVGPRSLQIWTCSGTGYATVCITGTVYDNTSGTGSVTNIDCYPSWRGGNWNATRTTALAILTTPTTYSPQPTLSRQPTPSSHLPTAKIVRISIGAVAGLALIAISFCVYWRWRPSPTRQPVGPSQDPQPEIQEVGNNFVSRPRPQEMSSTQGPYQIDSDALSYHTAPNKFTDPESTGA